MTRIGTSNPGAAKRVVRKVRACLFAATMALVLAQGTAAESTELIDRMRARAIELNRGDQLPAQEPVSGAAMVERAKQLRNGLPVAPDNPFRKPDITGMRSNLERALTLPGSHRIEAGNILADLLLATRQSLQDVKRAVELLEASAARGDAVAKLKLVELMKDGGTVPLNVARRKALIDEALAAGEPEAALLVAREAGNEKLRNEYVRQAAFMLLVRSRSSAAARRELARLYLNGEGEFASNMARAVTLYREAIALRDVESGPEIAARLLSNGRAADVALAREILSESVVIGSKSAGLMLARDAMATGPMKVDAGDAALLLEALHAAGDIRGSFLLTVAYRKGFGVAQSEGKAERILTDLMAPGKIEPDALLSFARSVRDGKDGVADPVLAERFFRAAADAGMVEGMFGYAQLVLQRRPDAKDAATAVGLLERAAAADHVRAIIALGDAYRDGTGVVPSRDTAGRHYQRAIKLTDSPVALERRGNLLLRAGSGRRAASRGVGFLERAAEKGSTAAMSDLGRAYIQGKLLPQDIGRGVDWLERARRAGSGEASLELAQLLEALPDAASRRRQITALYADAWARGVIEAATGHARIRHANGDVVGAQSVLVAAAEKGSGAAAGELVKLHIVHQQVAQADAALAKAIERTRQDSGQAAELAINLLDASREQIRDHADVLAAELAAKGNASTAAAMSRAYAAGGGRDKDIRRAIDFGQLAARAGDVEPLFDIAFAMLKGYGTEADPKRAAGLLEDILQLAPRHVGATLTLAEALRDGVGVQQDLKRSVALLREAWKSGSSSAALALGNAYFSGTGVARDPAEATRWYNRAAVLGVADANLILAKALVSGEGAGLDAEKSFSAYRRLASEGSSPATVAVGRDYLSGYGAPRDVASGIEWLERAAGKGDLQALYDLYHHYVSIGDKVAALQALRRAADAGTPDAQFRLAMLYRDGKGVEQSDDEMMRWLKRASDSGHEYATKLLGRVERVRSVKVLKVSLPSDH